MADRASFITDLNIGFENFFNSGNAKGISELYTADCTLSPPGANGQLFTGQKAVESFWQGALNAGLKNIKLTVLSAEEVGRGYILEFGAYKHSAGNGHYTVLWKKIGDDWKLHKDIFNV